MHEGAVATRLGLRGWPPEAEDIIVGRDLRLAERTGARYHVAHVSTSRAVRLIREAKSLNLPVSAEVTPHHLTFTDHDVLEYDTSCKVNPPLRPDEERQALREALADGTIDCVATDHAPHSDEEKGISEPFKNTWETISGFTGLEAEVAAMLTFVNEGRIPIEQWVYMHSARPAQIWGIYPQKGSLRVGTDADFTIFDPTREWTLEDRHTLHSKNTVTPFEGESFVGKVTATVVRGEIVYTEDEGVIGEPGFGTQVDVRSIDNDYGVPPK
jgi:dihydroorotase/allantoinase